MHEIAKDLSIFIAKDDCPITKYVQDPILYWLDVESSISLKFQEGMKMLGFMA